MNKVKLRQLLENIRALEDTMKFLIQNGDEKSVWRYSSYKEFMRKYNDIAIATSKEIEYDGLYDIYDLEKVPSWGNLVADSQKNYFHLVLTNASLLKSLLENKLDVKHDEIENLKNFFGSNLRKAMLHSPENEIEVQDVMEQLLIGKGLNKGIDYDREVGRVKISIKEVKPDFIFPKLSLAVEVKISKNKTKSKSIVDEINADIQSYSKAYKQILFVVYDLGTIRDETEFKNDIDNKMNIQLIVIKH